MNWLLFLILAYFVIAIGQIVDKFILTKAIPEPVAYVFVISTVGLVAVLLAPFGFEVPTTNELAINLLAGASYTFAVFFLYKALQKNEASRILTLVGALVAVSTFALSFIFLGERLSAIQVGGIALLIIGGIFISLEYIEGKGMLKGFGWGALAGVVFGMSYTATEYLYATQPFISAFIWIRIFAFLAVLVFLFLPSNINKIKDSFKQKSPIRKRSNQLVLLGGQTAIAIGFFLLNYTITLTNASIVLAAQGLLYTFLLILTLALSYWFPKILKEKMTPLVITQKVIAIVIIGFGLTLIANV